MYVFTKSSRMGGGHSPFFFFFTVRCCCCADLGDEAHEMAIRCNAYARKNFDRQTAVHTSMIVAAKGSFCLRQLALK